MAKYAQTLTANSYTPTDVNSRLKEAFDNMGWGTGKVDILGGYRYTATEETNSDATPLVINGADFIDNYQGKNIIRNNGIYSTGVVAMYLPGVKAFRINYTIVATPGTSIAWSGNTEGNPNSDTHSFMKAWFLSVDPNNNVNDLNTHWRSVEIAPATPTAPGSYTTPWVTGDIVGYPTVTFSVNGKFAVVIDSVEWRVDQNKFAAQSPNLDSPAFEYFSRTVAGNHITTLLALPVRNAKQPMVRVGIQPVRWNCYLRVPPVAQAHTHILYNTHPDPSSVGQNRLLSMCEVVAYGNYGVDMTIRAGSNAQFDGFYLNTTQSGVMNGTVWDTVDKSTAFPASVPQFPAVRKTGVSSLRQVSNNYGGNYMYDSWENGNFFQNHIFEVKNPINLSEIQLPDTYSSYYGSGTFGKVYNMSLTKVRVAAGGRYEVESIIVPTQTKTTVISNNTWYTNSFPTNIQLSPGLYCVSVSTPNKRNDTNYSTSYSTYDFNHTSDAHTTRDIKFLTSTTLAETSEVVNVNSIRYIRETQTTGTTMHWVEVQAFVGDSNVALNKPVVGAGNYYNNSVITDGNSGNTSVYSEGQSMTIDLQSLYAVDTIKIWHYYGDGRTYTSRLEVSNNGVDWVDITPSPYAESAAGKSTTITYPLKFLPIISNPTLVVPGVLIGAGSDKTKNHNSSVSPITQFGVRLVQSGSGTPVSGKTMFAETWYSIGLAGSHWGTTPKLNKLERNVASNYMGGNYKHVANGRFNFGLDHQMLGYNEEFLLSPQPGSVFNYGAANLQDWNSRQEVEFGKKPSFFPDGRPYRRAWLSSPQGTSLQASNLFILNGGNVQHNTSYMTEDGREYVIVFSAIAGDHYNSSDQTVAFRLR